MFSKTYANDPIYNLFFLKGNPTKYLKPDKVNYQNFKKNTFETFDIFTDDQKKKKRNLPAMVLIPIKKSITIFLIYFH